MTKPNYAHPAIVAAALHAVLLFAFTPDGPNVVISAPKPATKRWVEVPLEDPPPVARTEDETKVEPVKALRGDPPPPDVEQVVPSTKVTDFTTSIEEYKPQFISLKTDKIPAITGVPDGSPDGKDLRDVPGLIDVTRLDRMPRPRAQVAPNYPFSLKQTGIEGSVLVEFDVDASGQVIGARVLRSDRREFEEPTIRAVLKWRFEPGRRNGRVVPFRMQVPVDFHLNQD